jgi:hypothetical protein
VGLITWPVQLSIAGGRLTENSTAMLDASVLHTSISRSLYTRLSAGISTNLEASEKFTILVRSAGWQSHLDIAANIDRAPAISVRIVANGDCGRGCFIIGGDILMNERNPWAVLLRLSLENTRNVATSSTSPCPSLTISPYVQSISAPIMSPFTHPGIVVDAQQLETMRDRTTSRTGPIFDSYLKARGSPAGTQSTTFGPPPGGVIDCGAFSLPDYGCRAEGYDAEAALVQVRCMFVTGWTATL